jgi:hypothetical protein
MLLAVLLAAFAIHVHALLQPQRFTNLLEHDLAAAGLRLNLQAPAKPTLFPHPGVQLRGFSLANVGAGTPLLQANGATIVVPWRALLHDEAAIERVDIDTPRIDLGQIGTLLARLPRHAGPPRLPTIATGVHMSQGTLVDDGSPLLFQFNVDTGALIPDQPFHLEASASDAAGHAFVASLTTTPLAPRKGAVDFVPLRLHVDAQNGTSLQLHGHASWGGGGLLLAQLEGTLHYPSLAPPPSAPASARTIAGVQPAASASPVGQTNVTDKIAVNVVPAHGATPVTVALELDGENTHAELHLQPTAMGKWWTRLLAAASNQPPGPQPFSGTADVSQLDLGWLQAKGLHIEAGPDSAPASDGTVNPAPAAASSTTP